MHSLLLFGFLLRACLAVSLRHSARADRTLEHAEKRADHESGACLTASAGDWCHASVTWASEGGAAEHPDWFPGDAGEYSRQDFQSLLHQLGEAKCSRPCAQETGPAGRRTLGLVQGQSFTRKVDVNQTYGLSQEELEGVIESSWAPKARIGTTTRPGADEADTEECQDLQPGSVCYNSVTWLRTTGFKKHPAWYPQYSEDSTAQEVQELLHSLGRGDCEKPCQGRSAYKRVKLADDDKVLEIGVDGRQVVSEAYKIPEPASCRDTAEGEWCYTSIVWLKKSGLAKHPAWYPKLTRESSIADFQAALHKEHKMACPRPCEAGEQGGDTSASSAGEQWGDSNTPPERNHTVDCEDAQEEDSRCYKAISKIMDFNLWRHPEQYPGLRAHPSRDEVQEHLYQRGDYQCGWPCPKGQTKETRRVKKRISDMTAHELSRYMDKSWDGYVDPDQYDEFEPVQTVEKLSPGPQPAANERANESALEPEEEEVVHRHLAIVKSYSKSRTPLEGLTEQCRDARLGELCYEAATWAQEVGIHDHPSWYPGLSRASTLKDFQELLHNTKPGLCEMPCGTSEESLRVVAAPPVAEAAAVGVGPYVDGDGEPTDVYEEKWESEREGRHRPPAMVPVTTPAVEEPEAAAEEANSTAGVDSTAEELSAEEAFRPSEETVRPSAEELAAVSAGPSAEELAAAVSAEEASRPSVRPSAEELAAVPMDPLEDDASEDPLPSVDGDAQEVNVSAEEAQGTAEDANVSAEEAAAEAALAEANSTAGQAPQAPVWLRRAAEGQNNSTLEDPLPNVDGDAQEANVSAEEAAEAAAFADQATAEAAASAEANSTAGQAPEAPVWLRRAGGGGSEPQPEADSSAERLADDLHAEANATEAQNLRDEHAKLMEEHARLQEEHTRLKDVLEAKRLKEEHERLLEDYEKLKEEHARLKEERIAAELAPQPESAAAGAEVGASEAEAGTSLDLLPEVDMDAQEANVSAEADSSAERPADDLYAEANATEGLRDEHAKLRDEHAKLRGRYAEAQALRDEHAKLMEEHARLMEEHAQLPAPQPDAPTVANVSAEEALGLAPTPMQDAEGLNGTSAFQSAEAASETALEPESATVEAEAGTSEDLLPEVDMDGRDADPAAEVASPTESATEAAPAAERGLDEADYVTEAAPAAEAQAPEAQAPEAAAPAESAADMINAFQNQLDQMGQSHQPLKQTLAATEEVNATAEEPVAQPTDADQWIAGQSHGEARDVADGPTAQA